VRGGKHRRLAPGLAARIGHIASRQLLVGVEVSVVA
jgi:hypothetical protein